MENSLFDQIFFLFAGLFGYYSLYRLQGMRLYSLDAFFSDKSNKKSVLLRFILGMIANLIVAFSLAGSFYYYQWLRGSTTYSGLKVVAVISLIVSSSSLVLITHRFIAAYAIKTKNSLFLNDNWIVSDQLYNDTFGRFLANQETAFAHFGGGAIFLLAQAAVAFLISLLLKF